MPKEYKVGDVVEFKYDIEQCGPIEQISRDWRGKPQYHVRAFHGEYINDHQNGQIILLSRSDIFGEENEC